LITSLVFPHEEAAIAMLPKTWKIAWVHSSMHFSEHFAGNGRSSFEIKKLSGLQRVFANSRVAKLAMSEESQLLPQTSQREARLPGFGMKLIGAVSVGLLGCGLVLAAYLSFGSVQQEAAPGRELYHVSHVSHVSYVDDEAGHSHHHLAVPVPSVHHVHVSHSNYYGSEGSDGFQTLQAHVDDAFRPYHCYQHLGSWWSTWSSAKKDYCCQRHSVFCGTHASTEPEAVYDDSTMEGISEPLVHHVVHHVVHVGHHFGHSSTSSSSDIPRCGHSDNNCPAAWKSKAPGGYHCLHKLARQTSDKAYKASGGACRPVKLGAFPAEDCHAQCYVGRARSLSGGSSHHHAGSSHSGSFGASYHHGGSYHGGSHYHGGSYYHHGGSFQGGGSSHAYILGDSDGDSSYTYHHGYEPSYDSSYHDSGYHGSSSYTLGGYDDGDSSYTYHHGGSSYTPSYAGSYHHGGYHGSSSYTLGGSYDDGDSSYTYHHGGSSYTPSASGSYHHGGYHGSSSYTLGGSYHHGGSSHYEHGGHYSYHHSGHSHTMGGHYKMRGSYSSHHVPPCAGADHRCPAEWLSGETGGFHCKHKLKRQTSEKAYLKSGGACRPAKEGRFPFKDCEDQCSIGNVHNV